MIRNKHLRKVWWIECWGVPAGQTAPDPHTQRWWWARGDWAFTLTGAEIFLTEEAAQSAIVGAALCVPSQSVAVLIAWRRDIP